MNKIRYIYKITLLCGSLKDHYYIGQHTTTNINDGYAGSGCKVTEYYEKYGKIEGGTYNKEIIKYCNTLDELNEAEYDIIGDKYDTDPMCLNLAAGGKVCTPSIETRKKLSDKLRGRQFTDAQKLNMSNSSKKRYVDHPYLKGVSSITLKKTWKKYRKKFTEQGKQNRIKYNKSEKHRLVTIHSNKTRILSEETHKKMSESQKGRCTSEITKQKLSKVMEGRIWINDGKTCKRIFTDELNKYIEQGWKRGRKF